MFNKTTGMAFKKFGSIYRTPFQIAGRPFTEKIIQFNSDVIHHLYCYSTSCYIEPINGLATILIAENGDTNNMQLFSIREKIQLKPNVKYNIIPISELLSCRIIIPTDHNLEMEILNPPYVYKRLTSNIKVSEILAYYYDVRGPNYEFAGEQHDYLELTYVDSGSLNTTIDQDTYQLKQHDLIFYGKDQFHTQKANLVETSSYLTVLFKMDYQNMDCLFNRVFHTDKKVHALIDKFIKESSVESPFAKSLLVNHLEEIILLTLQKSWLNVSGPTVFSSKIQTYQDNLLEEIVSYIDSMIETPLTVTEVAKKFSLSRTAIQSLFKSNLDISPKAYMLQQKLKRSKELIREDKYTISEISFKLGFSSIHYFSRLFKQHFNISPSEYANRVYRN